MLKLLNAHVRDSQILFNEAAHVYTLAATGAPAVSVTTFGKRFYHEFDADKVLNKLSGIGVFRKKYGDRTKEDVKREWREGGRMAAEKGTRLHRFIELYFNGIETPIDEDLAVEVGMFRDWVCTLPAEYVPFRTEWIIFDESLGIAGTIDMLFHLGGNRVAIFDWKCSKEIKTKNKYEQCHEPLSHLDDCNYNHYCLQLNLYKHLLEKNYGLEVSEMKLVVIHRNHAAAMVIPVPLMKEEIHKMLATLTK